MTTKNADFFNSLSSNPKPVIGPTKPAPKPAQTYSDNAKYDQLDSPRDLLRPGDSQF